MQTEPRPKLTRRVVTGVNAEGRSVIVSDGETPTWVRRPTGSVVVEVWRADSLPAQVHDEPHEGADLVAPTPAGVSVRVAVFPPEKDVDAAQVAAYRRRCGSSTGTRVTRRPVKSPECIARTRSTS